MAAAQPDLLFGRIACHKGLLTESQLSAAIERQEAIRGEGRSVRLGELCVELGLLRNDQVERILLEQKLTAIREEDRLLGRLAVRNGLATEAQVLLCLNVQKAEHSAGRGGLRIGDILVRRGVLTEQAVRALLALQQRLLQAPPVAP